MLFSQYKPSANFLENTQLDPLSLKQRDESAGQTLKCPVAFKLAVSSDSRLTSEKYAKDPKIDSNMFFAVRLPTSTGDNGKGYVGGMCCEGSDQLKYRALIVEYEDSDVTFGRVT